LLNEIKELTTLLAECRQKLKEFKVQIQHLENQDSQTLQSKKQELKSLQDELTKCQQERDSIQTKLDKKVEELKSSQLSNDEKAQQITDLLTTHQKELDLINQELTQA
jgi:chromosome segregation ATPase